MGIGSKGYIIFGITALLVYGVWSISSKPVHDYSEPAIPDDVYPVKSHINIEFKIQNRTQRKLDNAELRFVLPAKQTSTQLVKKVTSSSSAFVQVLTDLVGNQQAYFQFDSLVPKEDLDIRIGVDLRLAETLVPDVAEDRSRYLADDPLLDLSHPNVQVLASQLVGEKVEVSVNNILGWLEKNKKKPSSMSEIGSTEFVRVKTEEHAIDDIAASKVLSEQGYLDQDTLYLFIALTRAMKIPSRVVVVLNTDYNLKGVYTFDDLAIYSEILLDKSWQAVDLGDHKLIVVPNSLTLRRLVAMPARQEVVQPYRLLFQSVGVEYVVGSEKFRFSSY